MWLGACHACSPRDVCVRAPRCLQMIMFNRGRQQVPSSIDIHEGLGLHFLSVVRSPSAPAGETPERKTEAAGALSHQRRASVWCCVVSCGVVWCRVVSCVGALCSVAHLCDCDCEASLGRS